MNKKPITRRIVGISAAVAACLAMGAGLAGTANASPASPSHSASVGVQSDPTLTLKALSGNSLAGHTFKFYQLGSYKDVTPATGDVTSFDLDNVPATKDALEGALSSQGKPVTGTAAHTLASLSEDDLHDVAVHFAANPGSSTTAIADQTGTGSTLTVTLPAGYYLIADSKGNPIIFGTQTDAGQNISGEDNTSVTIKSTDAESPLITTDPTHDPTGSTPADADHNGTHIPGDNGGNSATNSSHHIVRIAGDQSTSTLKGVITVPSGETGHNTEPKLVIDWGGTSNGKSGNVALTGTTFTVDGTPVTVNGTTTGKATTYDLSDIPAGKTVTFEATVTGTDNDVTATYSSKKADSTTVSGTADLQLVSVNPTILVAESSNHSVKINGATFTVTKTAQTNEPAVSKNVTTDTSGTTTIPTLGVGKYTATQTGTDSAHSTFLPTFDFEIDSTGKVTNLKETETPRLNLVSSTVTDNPVEALTPGFNVYNVKYFGQLATTGGFYTYLAIGVIIAGLLAFAAVMAGKRHKAVKD